MAPKGKARHDERAAAEPEAKAARNIKLRIATPLDCVALYDVLVHYFDDMALFYPAPNEASTLAWGLTVIISGAVVLAEEGGKIVGSVGLEWGAFPWAPSVKYLNGVWYYVTPEFRKGGTGKHLMRAAKDIAAKNGCGLNLGNVWGVEPELQDRWREINGFQYMGGNHVWFPPQGG